MIPGALTAAGMVAVPVAPAGVARAVMGRPVAAVRLSEAEAVVIAREALVVRVDPVAQGVRAVDRVVRARMIAVDARLSVAVRAAMTVVTIAGTTGAKRFPCRRCNA